MKWTAFISKKLTHWFWEDRFLFYNNLPS